MSCPPDHKHDKEVSPEINRLNLSVRRSVEEKQKYAQLLLFCCVERTFKRYPFRLLKPGFQIR
uniref:Uncharacterized protein n=1 Tax=Caudovirales sp. ctIbU14 TaxID=2825761 RepID=A0A8S5NRZ7_9CAUD|nr:MAG TPA: hypothetical protein [Caudovirales sp. ctIbU14]